MEAQRSRHNGRHTQNLNRFLLFANKNIKYNIIHPTFIITFAAFKLLFTYEYNYIGNRVFL